MHCSVNILRPLCILFIDLWASYGNSVSGSLISENILRTLCSVFIALGLAYGSPIPIVLYTFYTVPKRIWIYTNTNTNTNNLFTNKCIQKKIRVKYMIDNNVEFTVTSVGGRTNSWSCFRLSTQEPTDSSSEEQWRQNYIRAFTGYCPLVGRQIKEERQTGGQHDTMQPLKK